MRFDLSTANVATALVIIFALTGAALVVLSAAGDVAPELRLGFRDYLEAMVIAIGGLAIGRGIKAARR